MSLDAPKRVVECAASGRAKCRGACKQPIAKGALRFGTRVDIHDTVSYMWRCLNCITPQQAGNLRRGDAVLAFKGAARAQQAQVEALLDALEASDVAKRATTLEALGVAVRALPTRQRGATKRAGDSNSTATAKAKTTKKAKTMKKAKKKKRGDDSDSSGSAFEP